MLREILLRLPPQPSSLPRASAVCKRWRGLLTDPKFHHQFHAHHRKLPLLGFFHRSNDQEGIVFSPVLDPPDRIPPQRFHLGRCSSCYLLDCRHGLVLLRNEPGTEVVMCDLITRARRRVAIPLELRNGGLQGAVLRAAADHVHGSCPFKVVLVSIQTHNPPDHRPLASVYSSETGLWGNPISTEAPYRFSFKPVVLVGNCLYWLSFFDAILEFDLDDNSLTVIRGPPGTDSIDYENRLIIRAADGALGFAAFSSPRFQMWRRTSVNARRAATWVPWKTIEMHGIPGLPPQIGGWIGWLLGYDEDTDVVFLHASGNVYGVQLKSMQSTKLYEAPYVNYSHPFKTFYTPAPEPLLIA